MTTGFPSWTPWSVWGMILWLGVSRAFLHQVHLPKVTSKGSKVGTHWADTGGGQPGANAEQRGHKEMVNSGKNVAGPESLHPPRRPELQHAVAVAL